jgi:Coiled-coil domain-containing protein 55 (DUF2040)
LQGKDRFITASYKQKLKEQKQWKEQEDEEERQEEKNDVTKRGTMSHFYGNFNKNVAAGGRSDHHDRASAASAGAEESARMVDHHGRNSSSFLAGFAKSNDAETDSDTDPVADTTDDLVQVPPRSTRTDRVARINSDDAKHDTNEKETSSQVVDTTTTTTIEQRRQRQRKDREERVARARERFLLRHPELAATGARTTV